MSLRYDGSDVVSDVNFSLDSGELLGLVGESGSGKTTVALALLGHARRGLRISSGEVLLDGADLLAMDPTDLRAIWAQRPPTFLRIPLPLSIRR